MLISTPPVEPIMSTNSPTTEEQHPKHGGSWEDEPSDEDVWSFRGYHMRPAEFNTAMVHLYRGEVTRANTWRMRLDSTTNWAVVTTAAALSFAFSSVQNPHIMIPITTLLVALFLMIEARRYRYYELWSSRIRMMETDFYAAMLTPPFNPGEDWAARLSQSLTDPTFTISFWEALGRRFRRNYQFLFVILGISWIFKLLIHPEEMHSLSEFMTRAAVGPIPGQVIILLGVMFYGSIFTMGWLTAGMTQASGEVLRKDKGPLKLVEQVGRRASDILEDGPSLMSRRDRIAYVITADGEHIGHLILERLGRGVTSLEGRGMYTGEDRDVLLVAIHPDQIEVLKRVVYSADPHAFVIINTAQQIIGSGFRAPS